MMGSHYVECFTVQRRQLFRTACGQMVTMTHHSNEPDCPECKAWLEKSAPEDEATAVALEEEFPKEFGGRLSGLR